MTHVIADVHLLETIKWLCARFGDSVTDDELTELLRQTALPTEAGFAFLRFSDGCVTLAVPPQNVSDWYAQSGSFAPLKRWIARIIAQKHGLSVQETIQDASKPLLPPTEVPNVHNHLELNDPSETLVVAHPRFLKVRVFESGLADRDDPDSNKIVPLPPDLLTDLSLLYERKEDR
jgi:hypothetical protein